MFRDNNQLKDNIKNILTSFAYGDAFGMPTEMMAAKDIKAKIGNVDQFLPSQKNIYFDRNLPAGSVTDDTMFTLMLIDMLIEHNGIVDPHKYIDKISIWIESDLANAEIVGPSTTKAITLLKQGVPMERVGIFGTTNGAAMKVIPLGISNIFNDEDKLIEDVYKICLPTHNTKVAISGAILIAHLIRKICRKEVNWSSIWDESYRILKKVENLGVDTSHALISKRLETVFEIVNSEISIECKLEQLAFKIGTSMETIETIPTVLGLAFLSKQDVRFCARLAANIGGDTDTIGAISCSLIGAFNSSPLDVEIDLIERVNNLDFETISVRFMENILE